MDILFWSGGKDSFLALKLYRKRDTAQSVKLLTTYDKKSDRIPFQALPVQTIQKQAKHLGLEVLLTALPPNCPNDIYLKNVWGTLNDQNEPVENLLFGDWYLEDIRQWREQQFSKLGFPCKFPIWQENIDNLLNTLIKEPVEIRLSNVAKEYRQWIEVGDVYDQQFVEHLPDQINPMGENGEFHTKVIFPS